ncbi:MAG: aminopeptidase P family protein [Alphaproteobacteria bacterium]|nr:aminopeptidase P family protein [Alphaproteobacteria bacterium]
MFQSFEATTKPSDGPARLADLRKVLRTEKLAGFLVPRSDAHQGENVPARDERLAWLTGFTGSAGFCAALQARAGVFIDGRYTLQVREQIDLAHFTPVDWPATDLGAWLIEALPDGGVIGFDPWLHVKDQIDKLVVALEGSGISLREVDNLVDRIWDDQPSPPQGTIVAHGIEFSGEESTTKRARITAQLREDGQAAAVLSMPDSLAWLLNIRGADIARNPVALAFAILSADGKVQVFTDPAKANPAVRAHLGPDVEIFPPEDFGPALDALTGKVRIDKATAPLWISNRLVRAGVEIDYATDPCALPKACKNKVEIEGARRAHLRDGIAMAELLAWLDGLGATPEISEIDVVRKLEGLRARSNLLVDISFETICGTGPNGAIIHYRVTEDSNRMIREGDLLLVDSGGQYRDGTTDITRTIAIGTPTSEHRACFTRVLQGMIAISLARWPVGLGGRDLDPLARRALWAAGQDFDHGTGHGVGSFLGVHEGPQRLSRLSTVPFEPGMILSNEPGYYRAGAFGIRIENLVVVQKARDLATADKRKMLEFETISFTPIDRNLIDAAMLSEAERDWIDAYHAEIFDKIAPNCSPETQSWLKRACAPI